MKKIWFFLEGGSEEIFITNLTRNKLYANYLLEKDLSKFINADISSSDYNSVYCENCGSVDKIPHRINEMYYLIERSQANRIIIVCDVEKLKCHSKRKSLIESKFDEFVDKRLIKYAFFNPMIETAYWECPGIVKKIIASEYRKKFASSKVPEILLPDDISYSQDGLKKCFKQFNLKYRETTFAKNYFPKIDYENCSNNVFKRICEFLNSF